MASTLDLSNASRRDANTHIQDFFTNNTWTWGNYHEDQIILDANHSDFLTTLAKLATSINHVADTRGALHIHLHNVEQANTPLPPLLAFHDSIIHQQPRFDGYNLWVYAHSDRGVLLILARSHSLSKNHVRGILWAYPFFYCVL